MACFSSGEARTGRAWWRRPLAALACVALAAGCDFTPVLDIPLPEHQPGLVLHGMLVADSTVTLAVTRSVDPYTESQQQDRALRTTVEGATVELVRDGALVETLALRSETCLDYEYTGVFDPETGQDYVEVPYECGAYVSESRIEAAGTYTLRVRAEGAAEVSATVSVPVRPEVSEVTAAGAESVSFRVREPAGLGQRYAIQLAPFTETFTNTYRNCDYTGQGPTTCRDTTITETYRITPSFRTRDPLLLAAARLPPDEPIDLVTFDDRPFDGQERAFTIEPRRRENVVFGRGAPSGAPPEDDPAVWVVSLDPQTYLAYQATYFSLGEDNPFAEPANLPSNVVGGYGLVGAAAIASRPLPPEATADP